MDGCTHGQTETNMRLQLLRSWGHKKIPEITAVIILKLEVYLCTVQCPWITWSVDCPKITQELTKGPDLRYIS